MPTPLARQSSILVPVILDYFLETDGSATDRRVNTPLPDGLDRVGYQLESIQAITRTRNRTTNHRWNGEISIGVDGLEWWPTTPNDIFSYVTTDGVEVQAALTDTTKFAAPFIRTNLACSNSTGSARESAYVSLWLTFNFRV